MSTFYVRDPSDRRAFIQTADQPTDRWERFVALETPMVVHGKMGGRYKKDVEGVLYALSKDRFLIAVDDKTWGHLDTYDHDHYADQTGRVWHDLYDPGGFTEGFRFRKNVTKLLKFLNWLMREMSKKRKSAEKLAAIEAERGHRVGKCPVCFGDFIVDDPESAATEDTKMVLHGYQRPGHGYIVGNCGGVGWPNLEVSPKGSANYLEVVLRPTLKATLEAIKRYKKAGEVMIAGYGYMEKPKMYKKGDASFDSARDRLIREAEQTERYLRRDIEIFEEVLRTWAPQKWPRKDAPKK